MNVTVKILITIAILALDLVLQKTTQHRIDRHVEKNKMPHRRNVVMHKIKSVLLHSASIVAIIMLWGVSLQNIWVSIAGLLGLVAIGFFAVWSILSNIFAGIVIFFTRPFQIEDTIELLPEGIKGKVKDINGFFTILVDEDGNTLNVPNNFIYQKIVKTHRS
ncbi:MAG: mechanosensitive ion channel family protein [Spirochaetales bacterium]|nr:mechanosensitive ion channel family protein [Spirochaetales bacterium]MCF7939717.1 mechanosensitive ion channel family protein [Spirochaetales bacterium]